MFVRAVLGSVFLLGSSVVLAEGEVFALLESRSYSEPTSIHSFIHEFDGDYEGGEYAFTESRAELGARYGAVSISYLLRYDHFYDFDSDTARGYYEIENKLPQSVGSHYDIYLDVNHIRARGIKAAFDFSPIDKLKVNLALSYLKASRIIDGRAKGYLDVVGENSYEGRVDLTVVSDEDKIFEYQLDSPEGQGFALDIALHYTFSDKWSAGLQVVDAYSRIKWEDALYSQMHLTSAVRSFDDDGRLVTGPYLSGVQILDDHTQKLPEKFRSAVSYQWTDRSRVDMESYITRYFAHNTFAYQYQLTDTQSIGLNYTLETEAIGVSYRSTYFDFRLAADSLDYEKAHALDLIFALKVPF